MTARRLVIGVISAVTVVVLIAWAAAAYEVYAQSPLTPTPTVAALSQPPVMDPTLAELQSENRQLQRDMDRMIGLVAAGTGLVVTMAAILVAAQFLFTMRVYERDKAAMQEDLKGSVSQIMSERGERIAENVKDENDRLRAEISARHENLNESLKTLLRLDLEQDYTRIRLNHLQSDLLVLQGWYGSALFYEIQVLREELKSGSPFMALPGSPGSYAFQSVGRIGSILTKMQALPVNTRADLAEILSQIPSQPGLWSVQVKEVLDQAAAMPVVEP